MTTDRIIIKRAQPDTSGLRPMQVLAALPSILGIIVILLIAVFMRHPSDAAPEWYRTTAEDAFDNHDFKTAAVCYQRLLQSKPGDPTITMDLAQSLGRIGQLESAVSLLYRMAPLDQPGYFPAQVVLASTMLQPPKVPPETVAIAVKHLKQALAVNPTDPGANAWMAIASAFQGDWPAVTECLTNCPKAPAGLYYRLSAIAEAAGNHAQAQKWTEASQQRETVRPN